MVNVAKIDVHLKLVNLVENVFGVLRHVQIVVHARKLVPMFHVQLLLTVFTIQKHVAHNVVSNCTLIYSKEHLTIKKFGCKNYYNLRN